MTNNNRVLILLLLFLPVFLRGQQGSVDDIRTLKAIITDMKNSRNAAYSYTLSAEFPDGRKDQLSGEVYIGNDRRLMFNANNAQTIIYDGLWFYRADHVAKTISVVNVQKHLNKEYREALEKDVFENNTVSVFLDSVILKHANVKSVKRQQDTITIQLDFPERSLIRDINLVYDDRHKVMVSYVTRTFQQWPTDEFGEDKGTTKQISCSKFRKTDGEQFSPEKYFRVKNEKLTLKKYSRYKVTSKL